MASQNPSPIGASPRSLSAPQDAKSNPSNGLVERVAGIVDRAQLGSGEDFARTPQDWADQIHALYQQEGVLSSQRGENRSANASLTPDAKSADTEALGSAEKKAFLAGWWVNAAEPDKDGAASRAYFESCAETDWRDFAARATGANTSAEPVSETEET